MERFREEYPYVYTLNTEVSDRYCAYCFKWGEDLKVCGKCRFCRYCDQECQKSGWKSHKNECHCLSRSSEIPDKQVRLVARIIFKMKQGDNGETTVDGEKRCFQDLMSHEKEISKAVHDIQNPSSFREEALITASINSLISAKNSGQTITNQTLADQLKKTFQSEDISKIMRGLDYINFAQNLKQFLGEKHLSTFDDKMIMDVYGKVCINSFAIDSWKNEPIGTGLYIGFSILDHSCDPDLSFNFDGPTAFLTNLKPWESIKSKPLKELRISYLEPGLLRDDRLEKLRGRYYFQCSCQFCNDNLRESRMRALLCPKDGCGSPVLLDVNKEHVICETCHHKLSDISAALELMETKNSIIESIDTQCNAKDYQSAYSKAHELIPKIRSSLHPTNRIRAELSLKCSGVAKALLNFKEASDLCEEALLSERVFVPERSPNWIFTNVEQARTLLASGNKVKAYQYAKQAVSLCEQIYGKSTPLHREIKELIKLTKPKQKA